MKNRKGFSYIETNEVCLGKLYNTVIYKREGNKVTLNSGAWRTRHTKNCINDVAPFRVFQKDFNWYVHVNDKTIPFEDNMLINLDRRPKND